MQLNDPVFDKIPASLPGPAEDLIYFLKIFLDPQQSGSPGADLYSDDAAHNEAETVLVLDGQQIKQISSPDEVQ